MDGYANSQHGTGSLLVAGDGAERPEIGNYRGGILASHAELRHGRAERLAGAPDAGGEQGDKLGVGSGRRTGKARGLQGPVGCWDRGLDPERRAFKPAAAVEVSGAVAGRVAHAARGYVFDEVFAADELSVSRLPCGFVLPGLLRVEWDCEAEEQQ
jgi:hypothetical protein